MKFSIVATATATQKVTATAVAVTAITTMLLSTPSYADTPKGLFITAGVQQYVSSDNPIDNPSTGFRIGAGYELPLTGGGGQHSL